MNNALMPPQYPILRVQVGDLLAFGDGVQQVLRVVAIGRMGEYGEIGMLRLEPVISGGDA